MISPLLLLLGLLTLAGARYARGRAERMEREAAVAVLSGAEPSSLTFNLRWFLFRSQITHRIPMLRGLYVLQRLIQGARPLRNRGFDAMQGSLRADGIDISFGGGCPVQGDGSVDGRDAYYRSRGEGWSLDIAKEGETDALAAGSWCYEEAPYIWPDGGWVPAEASAKCILRAVAKWRAEGRP